MEQMIVEEVRSFNRFYTRVIGLLDQYILNSEFTLPEARVLYELYHRQHSLAAEMAAALDMDKSYLSRMLDQFEQKKLIRKQRSTVDGRSVYIALTAKGEKAFEKLNEASHGQIKRILESLSAADCHQLLQQMSGMRKILSGATGMPPVSLTATAVPVATAIPAPDITIRTKLRPGDLGHIIHMHGRLYSQEYDYGIAFEMYVAEGLGEFYRQYDPAKDRVWICEDKGRIIGFLLLMHREANAAQLRYFIIEPEYRGIGLGKKLVSLYMDWLRQAGYRSAYLWTTHELEAAASLYKRHGFTLVEEKPSAAFGKPLYEQKYELSLDR